MGGFTPGSEEQWTPDKIHAVFEALRTFLWDNEDICFIGELRVKAERAGIITRNELHYLIYEKNINSNDSKILKEIGDILEFRCAKTKEMYPGIAAMALKNKHGWTDGQNINLGGQVGFSLLETKIKDKIADVDGS